jgi:hypothetical protein
MKADSLTNHAKKRISKPCGLAETELRQLLDVGAGTHIHLQMGGRHSHRLVYSFHDAGWFMVVQDGGEHFKPKSPHGQDKYGRRKNRESH